MNSENSAALREAREMVAAFETQYRLSTKDMLMCAEGDQRLAKIDQFELMDWHYALEIINALEVRVQPGLIRRIDSSASEAFCFRNFKYDQRTSCRELTNSIELELELVA